MVVRAVLLPLVLSAVISVAGCRVPMDRGGEAHRGSNSGDPGASSFAFFGGLKAFFVDDTPPPSTGRPVNDADLTRVDVAPVHTATPAATATSAPQIR